MNDSSWMASIAGKYVTKNTIIGPAGGGISLALTANPRRYFIAFFGIGGFGGAVPIFPGPVPPDLSTTTPTLGPQQYKFSDCPSLLQGEWYYYDDNIARFVVCECIYTGE